MLRTELTLLAGFGAGWVASGASPAGWAQFGLLATLAAAMGMQSAAVNDMGLAQVSTTFLTGTLTGLVSSLVSPGKKTPYRLRRYGVLAGLLAGATLGGLLVATAPYGVPALPLAAWSRPWPPRVRCRASGRSVRPGGAGRVLAGGRSDPLTARDCHWGCQDVAMSSEKGVRPKLKAGLLPLWRDRDTLQFGVDPRRAVALGGLGEVAAIISLLDGSRDRLS